MYVQCAACSQAACAQVPRKMIGTDGFQETPIVEVTRQITKHNYLVMDVKDIPRVVKEVQASASPASGSGCGFSLNHGRVSGLQPASHVQGADLQAPSPAMPVQAFYVARTGRPGPVLVDIPKDVQQAMIVPDWTVPMALSGYMSRLPQPPQESALEPVIDAIHQVRGTLSVLQHLPHGRGV